MATQIIDETEVIWRLRMLRAWSRKTTRQVEAATKVGRTTVSRIERTGTRDFKIMGTLIAFYSTFTAVEVRLADLLDPDFDTRVWFNGRTQASQA